MLGESNLLQKKGWFDRARLWRIVLLMRREGYWDPTPGIALGVLAQFRRPADAGRGAGGVGAMPPQLACLHRADAENPAVEGDGGQEARPLKRPRCPVNTPLRHEAGSLHDGQRRPQSAAQEERDTCPVSFTARAIEWSVPKALADLEFVGPELAGRLWVRAGGCVPCERCSSCPAHPDFLNTRESE